MTCQNGVAARRVSMPARRALFKLRRIYTPRRSILVAASLYRLRRGVPEWGGPASLRGGTRWLLARARCWWLIRAQRSIGCWRRWMKRRTLFGRSLRLRQVSAGGCNAREADVNVLGTLGGPCRFGIQFVASPRHEVLN